jgi:SAM-dependent methyltransferase
MLQKINRFLGYLGFRPRILINNVRGIPFWLRDMRRFRKQMSKDFKFKLYPILGERFEQSGTLCKHYFLQDLLVAQKIFRNNPSEHIDIGSRVDGFVAHVASYRHVKVFDIRPLETPIENITFEQRDIMEFYPDLENRCESISALHVIEHFGLGRYSDPVCADGHLKALENIHHYLKPGGTFYFSVPIARVQRVDFNANRVFSLPYLLNLFRDKYRIVDFVYIPDDESNGTVRVALPAMGEELPQEIQNSFDLYNGCGIFELQKI